ncbi:MAG: c-type cytochrome [Phycisphaerae bacterium]|jgi:putative membrane-bound dehydrogenase-like protein
MRVRRSLPGPLHRRIIALNWPAWLHLLLAGAALAGPLSPEEALQSFELADDSLTIELVAAEPLVLDPVAMAFDEAGRLFVAEMRGFQLGPGGQGVPGLGQIRLLHDIDGDGRMDRADVFAEGMFHPVSVLPAFDGVLVSAAPDLLFFQDRDGDGRAEVRVVLFTGFGQGNHEQLFNSLQWGLDNWIYAVGAQNGGDIRPGDQPGARPVALRGRDFRFRLRADRLGALATRPAASRPAEVLKGSDFEFETTTGGGQYGLTADPFERWFTCSNARHIIEIMLPEKYLRRNPYLAVPAPAVDVSDHGPAAKIARISPLEEWRVIRTQQRAAGSNAARYTPSELVPGGFFTAACGITLYEGDALPRATRGDAYVCDAANNLVHRDRLTEDGVGVIARRVDEGREFLASRDSWCRPVALANGPDGCLYVVDMYRQIIETPDSIPPDILKTINMQNGKDQGRIYRVRPKGPLNRRPPLVLESAGGRIQPPLTAGLVPLLSHSNQWWRLTAQRLLVERQDPTAVGPLRELLASQGGENGPGRLHALCTLDGLGALDDDVLIAALRDERAEVRVHALRLSEERLARQTPRTQPAATRPVSAPASAPQPTLTPLARAVLAVQNDPAPRVRFQLAFTLGELDDPEALPGLAALAGRDGGDKWMRTAILSSVPGRAAELWRIIQTGGGGLTAKASDGARVFIEELLAVVGARRDEATMAEVLESLAGAHPPEAAWWRAAALTGLTHGFERAGGPRPSTQPGQTWDRVRTATLALIGDPDAQVRRAARRLASRLPWPTSPELTARLEQDLRIAETAGQPVEERISAIEFLVSGDLRQVHERLEALLRPEQPPEIQKAVVAALIRTGRAELIARLLTRERWQGYTPAVRDAVLDAVFARSQYVPILLTTIEQGEVPAWAVDAARVGQLLAHRDQRIRARAEKLLKSPSAVDRQKAYENYLPAVQRPGDPARGREVFRVNCAACHVLEGLGSAVGPDLASVRDRDPAALLRDILDPSAAIVAGYSYYVVDTHDGETVMGVIASESANTVTVRQREGLERTLLRSNIAAIFASGLSMMPGDFERSINLQEMADLIAYLKAAK